MISYGNIVSWYKSKFEIDKTVATETNLIIKTVEQSDEAIYRCKKTQSKVIIGERQLKVESKWLVWFGTLEHFVNIQYFIALEMVLIKGN